MKKVVYPQSRVFFVHKKDEALTAQMNLENIMVNKSVTKAIYDSIQMKYPRQVTTETEKSTSFFYGQGGGVGIWAKTGKVQLPVKMFKWTGT